MKKRVLLDSLHMWFGILITVYVCSNSHLYFSNPVLDNVFDFFGFTILIKGILFRSIGRGHKMLQSQRSAKLVTTGPYSVTRNPMYLGSMMLGTGFVMILWPCWVLPLFWVLFLWRFSFQVKKEETFLEETFGQEYIDYCKEVPRVVPHYFKCLKMRLRDMLDIKEAVLTKERRMFVYWPIVAVVFESIQEIIVFGSTNIYTTLAIFASVACLFALRFKLAKEVS